MHLKRFFKDHKVNTAEGFAKFPLLWGVGSRSVETNYLFGREIEYHHSVVTYSWASIHLVI